MALSVTLQSLLNGALRKLGSLSIVENVPGDEVTQCIAWANQMIDAWGLEPGTIPFEKREVFPLIAGKGGTGVSTPTSGPYTLGPTGDFDTVRIEWLTGAGLLQLSPTPQVELSRSVLTNDAYQSIPMKDLQSEYFTAVYLNASYPLAEINLYPVPNTTVNSLVLYSLQPIAGFADLSTVYVFPPGYAQTIEDNLATILADPYARPIPQRLQRRADSGLSKLKRANAIPTDLAIDPALTESSRRPWNILSDS